MLTSEALPSPGLGSADAAASAPASAAHGVTVVVTRLVKPGREADYEAWLQRLIAQAAELAGYLGATLHRPAPTGPRQYTSVFRFDSVEHLRQFEDSELRRRALAEAQDFVEADASWRKLTGLELWFTAPPGAVMPQPSRVRMALLLIVVVYGLVLSIGKVVALVLQDVPSTWRLLITITLEVFAMTYVVMPRLTRWLARWIYPA